MDKQNVAYNTMKYQSSKEKEILTCTTKRMNLGDTRLSQISHKETNTVQFHLCAELRTVSSMEAEGRMVAEGCRQVETLPLSIPFTLQPAEHPQLKDTSAQHPRECRTSDGKGGWAGTHRGGGTRETARVVPAILASG